MTIRFLRRMLAPVPRPDGIVDIVVGPDKVPNLDQTSLSAHGAFSEKDEAQKESQT
jgi:hypothetical protein